MRERGEQGEEEEKRKEEEQVVKEENEQEDEERKEKGEEQQHQQQENSKAKNVSVTDQDLHYMDAISHPWTSVETGSNAGMQRNLLKLTTGFTARQNIQLLQMIRPKITGATSETVLETRPTDKTITQDNGQPREVSVIKTHDSHYGNMKQEDEKETIEDIQEDVDISKEEENDDKEETRMSDSKRCLDAALQRSMPEKPGFLSCETKDESQSSRTSEQERQIRGVAPMSLNDQRNVSPAKMKKDAVSSAAGETEMDTIPTKLAMTRNVEQPIKVKIVVTQEGDAEEIEEFASKDLLSFAWQISRGMDYLSSKGFVHCDLAARNILVGEDKMLKISDFGLMRQICGEIYEMKRRKKLPIKWMAPEALYNSIYTTKSDVWAFGILLWELGTMGGMPYPGIRNREMCDLLKTGYRMEKPDSISEELYAVMLDCWKENPDERPTFQQLTESLEEMMTRNTPYCDFGQLDESKTYYNQMPSASDASTFSTCL